LRAEDPGGELRTLDIGEWQRNDLRRQGQPDISWVDDESSTRLFAEVFLEGPNPTRHGRARRCRELYFNRDQPAAGFDNQIDLHSGRSAPEMDLWLLATIDERFHNLKKNGGFQDGPAQRTRCRVVRILQTSQVA
jgi:hypothetical protein